MAVRTLLTSRELTSNLVARDLKVRYKGSVLGFFWSLLNPILLVAVFTLVFRVIARIPAPVNPEGKSSFAAFVLTGLLPWNYLINSIVAGSTAVTSSGALIRKVFFAREALPLSVVLAHGVSFLLELAVMFAVLGIFGFAFWRALYALPVVLVFFAAFALGIAMLLSAVNVYLRDTQQLLGIVSLAWFYATPIIYPIELVEKHLHGALLKLYLLNPATNFIRAFRSILYDGKLPSWPVMAYMPVCAAAALGAGWAVFRALEPRFAEEV